IELLGRVLPYRLRGIHVPKRRRELHDAAFPLCPLAYRWSVSTGELPRRLLPFFPSRDNKRGPSFAGSSAGSSALENLPAFRRRKDAKLLTVLGHRPTGDFDVLILEQLDDPLIRVRILRTLRANDLFDLELDRLGRQILAVGASNPRVEKVLQLVDSLRRMDVLVRRNARHSRFVHSDVLR